VVFGALDLAALRAWMRDQISRRSSVSQLGFLGPPVVSGGRAECCAQSTSTSEDCVVGVHPLAVPADVEVGVCTAVAGAAEHRGVCCPVRPGALGPVLGGHQAGVAG
jgi:hypothetical protein